MKSDDINWKSGRVRLWDLDEIDEQLPVMGQLDNLKEDLVLVEYRGGVLLDAGWYPEFSEEGRFVVSVVVDSQWDVPLYRQECQSTGDLVESIARAIGVAEAAVR